MKMEKPENPSLEKILVDGMDEARRFFSDGLAPTARYVLSTVRKEYSAAQQPIPDALIALQKDFDDNVRKTYPPRMISALKNSDYKKAASLFSVYIAYTCETGMVPKHLQGLQDEIAKGNLEKQSL